MYVLTLNSFFGPKNIVVRQLEVSRNILHWQHPIFIVHSWEKSDIWKSLKKRFLNYNYFTPYNRSGDIKFCSTCFFGISYYGDIITPPHPVMWVKRSAADGILISHSEMIEISYLFQYQNGRYHYLNRADSETFSRILNFVNVPPKSLKSMLLNPLCSLE